MSAAAIPASCRPRRIHPQKYLSTLRLPRIRQGGGMTTNDTTKNGTLLDRLDAAEYLAPVGTGRRAVPVTIGGTGYDGIAAVPLAELVLCSATDYEAMEPAQRSHRSR